VAAFTSLLTHLVINGYIKNYWGASDNPGILYDPIQMVSIIPLLYSLCILYRKINKTKSEKLKKQVYLVLQGTIITLFIGSLANIVLPGMLHINFLRIGSSATIIWSIFLLKAVKKHHFLSITTEEVANDLFTNIKDGIILLNHDETIIQANESAKA